MATTESKPQQEVLTAEGLVKTPIQTDIEEFISVAEDFKIVKETLQAKIASEPQLKKAAQQEIQLLLSCVDEVQAVKESLQAKTVSEPSIYQATQNEIMQVLHACVSLQNAKEALEAKTGELKLHSAVQAELQQILSSTDSLQTIKQSITAKVAEVESLISTAQIEKVDVKTAVDLEDKLEKASSKKADEVVEKPDVQRQMTTTESKSQQEVPTAEGLVKTPIQTDIEEFISVAEDFKIVKETLQAKIATEPQLKKAAQQEIQLLLSCVDEVQAVKESLQAKTTSEPSFHQATQTEIMQVLHTCESLQNAKEAFEAKTGELKLHSAVQAELQQILCSADPLQTIKESITAKVSVESSVPDTVQLENVEVKMTVDLSDKLVKVPSTKPKEEIKNIQKPEVKEILLTEKLKQQNEPSTADAMVKTSIQADVQEFISVAEDIEKVKERLRAKIVSEPKLNNTAQQEIQQILAFAEDIYSVKQGFQAQTIQEELILKQATQEELQEVLRACGNLQNIKELLEVKIAKDSIVKTAINTELQQMICSVESLQNIKKSISAKVSTIELLSSVVPQYMAQSEIQQIIKVAEKISNVTDKLQAKVTTEPQVKKFVQVEVQQLSCVAKEIEAIKESIQAKSVQEPQLQKATKSEMQQILTACQHLKDANEALETKSAGITEVKSALQDELQQLLYSSEVLQNLNQVVIARITQEQALEHPLSAVSKHVPQEEGSTSAIFDKASESVKDKSESKSETKEKTKKNKGKIVEEQFESQSKVEIRSKENDVEPIKQKYIKRASKQKEDQVGEHEDSQTVTVADDISIQVKIEPTEIQAKDLGTKKTATYLHQETNIKPAIPDPNEIISKAPEEISQVKRKEETLIVQDKSAQQFLDGKDVTITKTSVSETITGKTVDTKEIVIDKETTEERDGTKLPPEVISKESEIKSLDVQPSQTEDEKSKKEPSKAKVSKEKKEKLTETKKSQDSEILGHVNTSTTEQIKTKDDKTKVPEESKVEDKQIRKTDEIINKDEIPFKTAEDTKISKDLRRKSESRKKSDGTVKGSLRTDSKGDGKAVDQSIIYVSEVTTSQKENTPGDQVIEPGKGEIVPGKTEDCGKKPSVKKGKDASVKSKSLKKATELLTTDKLIEDNTKKEETNKEDVSTKEVGIAHVMKDNLDMSKKVVEVSEIKSTEPNTESLELRTRIRKPVSSDLDKETILSPTHKQDDIRDAYESSNTQEANGERGRERRRGCKTPNEEREIENKLYIDESSTSDYSSQSQSESYNLKKSQSYESRQWIYDSKPKVEIHETLSTYTPKQVSDSKRYESPASTSILEGTTYQRRQTAAKPLFCGRLVNRTAAQGSRLRVTCSLIGSPEPTVQWFKDGQPLSGDDLRLQTRLSNGLASLEINAATLGDTGKYTCIARNHNGEATTTSHVKIFSYLESAPEAPVFTKQVKDEYNSSADELVIQCRVKGYPLPTVSWFKDGLPLQATSRYQQTVARDGTCKLVVHGPEPSDSGLYKCVAENSVWSEQTSGCVMFEGREKYLAESRSLESRAQLPRFTNILSEHVVREGGTVALQVAIKGSPRADVTWYRGSEPLPKKSSRFRYLEDAGVYSLVMSDASTAEAGTYTCRAANAHGYRDTALFVQVVGRASRGKPAMFVSRPDTTLNIAMGEDINFSFRVSGDPKPKVTWMKGMKDITTNIRTMKETVNDYVRLTLKHATIVDSGTYFIMAKNCHGADHAFVTVRVRQRARSLTPTRPASLWSAPDTSTILRDIHESTRALVNDVPGPVSREATVTDRGKNWVSLSWGKPEHRGAAPVLAYRVESWMLGSEGGAQWTELGVTPINSFDAFFLKPGGEYKFRITARNRYGWGESVTSTEPVVISSGSDTPPDIVRDLEGPLKALLGDSLTLECEITGDPAPTIQWLRDGQDVGTIASLKGRVFVSDSQTTHRLIIKQLSEDDSGRYVCEAVNPQGRASTYARLLVVTDPRLLEADRKLKEDLAANKEFAPQLTMRLRDRRVQQSYPVRLTCQVAANPAPTITWAHDGQPVTDGGRYTQRVEADHFYTLELPRTLLEDSGQYTVTAQNCLGAVSCSCQLVVDKGIRAYVAPDFIAPLDLAASVAEGAELRIFAQVEAYPSVGIAWQRDGVRLRPSRRLVMTVDPEGRVELALAHITARDAGLYCCTATNAVGRAETTCQVSVTAGGAKNTSLPSLPSIVPPGVPYSKEPRFVTKPRCSEAVEGDTVVITCEVVGDPQPEVMWLRDWLKPGYYRDAPQFRQVAGGSGIQYSLEIPQVKLDFTGTYCVIATNPHGEAKAIISLQIFAKGQGKESSMVSGQVKHGKVETLPEIKRELKDLRCCDGDSATLECLVFATPLPAVRWEKDGKILPLGEDIEAEVEGEVARLTIRKVYPEDEGQYSCVAYNDLGRAVTSACLVVDVPEEKDTLLSQQLTRPPGLLSARSTPRSTPRHTPSPSRSISPGPSKYREFSSPSFSRPKRIKMSSPKFYTVPHNRIAEEGETIRFQCAVAGHPTPWASWDKDGHIVTPSARLSVTERDDLRTLELREVTVDDAGLYRVTLENEMGSVEATARLDVIGRQGSRTRSVRAWSAHRASPTFGRRLVGSAARVGGTFTLSCDVHASPSPATSWYRNGELLVLSDRVLPSWDGRRAQLELRGLQPEDGGVYTCVAENAAGTTQCAAELRVLQTTDRGDTQLQPPVFLQGLSAETTAAEGVPLELQVRLQGSGPLEVVWVKDGLEIPDCEDFRHVDYGDGRYGLRIADVFPADAGTYNCEAFNDHGDAITSGHLIVSEPEGVESRKQEEPEICFTKTPGPVVGRLRGQASFCARLRLPDTRLCHTVYSWTVGGRNVSSSDDRFTVTTEDDCSILQIRDIRSTDAGPVTCTARVCSPGEPPTTVTCGTHLSLDCAPGSPAALLRGPCDTTAMRGDRVLLKATYRGTPEPTVRWLKAGRELRTEGRVQIVSQEGVSCLTISAITADDSGKYVVSVENIHGADCHYASVAVEGPPEPPAARPSVSAATGEGGAIVAWSSPPYDGGCVLTGYRLEMRPADSADWSVVADRCHSLSHVVCGLEAGCSYVFRVRAENIHGASESSSESFPFTFHPPVTESQEDDEEEPSEENVSRLVSLEPGEEFTQRYSVHEELGKGRYGVVHKVTDLRSGHTMAAKFVRCIKQQDREKVQEEIDIMNCLRHPKLLQLTAAFSNPRDVVMVTEYISGGELFERVVADDFTLTERDCILFLRQICEGVSYMHKSNVVHLDLKPENIMCQTRTSHRIKIIDFGLAQKLASNTPVRVLFGTPEFIPPEIINYEPIGVETDMWSVGVITYVLLSGLSPFMGDNDAETFANITRADYDFDDEAFDAISQDAKDFIGSLLVKRKEERPTADECLRHDWLTQCDLTMSCVKLSTDKLKKFIIRRKWQPRQIRRQIA